MGKDSIYIWEKPDGYLHEDEAAEALRAICMGPRTVFKGPVEGKIELFAEADGLFDYNVDTLNAINSIEELIVAARHPEIRVKAGDKLAGMKAVPLVIAQEKLDEARRAAGPEPLMRVLPWKLKTACVITTGSEVAAGRIKDTFTPVIQEKLASFGIEIVKHLTVPDGLDNVAAAIKEAREAKPDIIACTGGMSVDPDDNTPGAIARSGARLVTYGVPVAPGLMFLLAYFDDGAPIIGIPGCAMYSKATVLDMILPRLAAGKLLQRSDFTRMGAGGLCLGCAECRYPVCPFGGG
jgi:hypothetical protein